MCSDDPYHSAFVRIFPFFSHTLCYGGEAMMFSGAKKQTVILTGVNAVVRALGLAMRVMLSRLLGAEVMGVMELAQSVHMVIIAPLTSGLPAAISRMTAKAATAERLVPMYAGLRITRSVSLVLIPLLWLLSPVFAGLTGDMRVLPSLWFSAPCVLILGYSAVLNGYCYGTGQSLLPAASELVEQIVRFALTFLMLRQLYSLTAGWLAAVPTAATLIAEIIGLVLVMTSLHTKRSYHGELRDASNQIVKLAFPTTVSRLIQTLLRSLTAILIPSRLQTSGLAAAEATARLGMLNGMVMPILMLPGVFTSALSMVSLPKIAKAEEHPSELKRLLMLCAAACLPTAAVCAGAIHVAAPFAASRIYRLPELTELFQLCAPLTVLMAAGHMTGNVLSALGLQNASMGISCISSVLMLLLTWHWTANPLMRIHGVVYANYTAQLFSILLSVLWLMRWRRNQFRSGDKCA